jgi:hypothetical protein
VEPRRVSADALVAALRARGLIAADAPSLPDESDRPWYLSLLMGIAGWVAGLFVLGFIVALLDVKSARDVLTIGVVLLGSAWALYAASRSIVFLDQLALALSIAGQIAVALYLVDEFDRALPAAAILLGLQLLLFAVMSYRVARSLAALAATIAWVFVVRSWMRPHEAEHAFIDPHGILTAPLFGPWAVPVEWLLTWAPPITLVVWLRRAEARWLAHAAASWARPALTGLLLGIALGGICAEPQSLLFVDAQGVGLEFSWWTLVPLLSIALAMFAAHVAFSLRNAGLLGTCVVATLVHLGRFYYLYGTTLKMKSLIMLVMGLVLLGAGRMLDRRAKGAA